LSVKIDTELPAGHWHDFAECSRQPANGQFNVFGRRFSRYYNVMLPSRFVILFMSMTASSIACHPKIPEQSLGDPQGEVSVRVINRNRIDVMVYVSHDGIRNRLGLATASTTTDFTLPLRMLGAGHEYRLIGDPLGVRIVITTETLTARDGDEVTWSLEDSFARSTVVVH
jgi:hypothetical protein